MGAAQGAAMAPGISRSGATISTGLMAGIEEEEAVAFSFLISIPAILGALLYESLKSPAAPRAEVTPVLLLAGMFAAFSAGLCCIKLLVTVVKRRKLHYFAPYCVAAGVLVLFLTAAAA